LAWWAFVTRSDHVDIERGKRFAAIHRDLTPGVATLRRLGVSLSAVWTRAKGCVRFNPTFDSVKDGHVYPGGGLQRFIPPSEKAHLTPGIIRRI
jgi:hypothetical protein